MIKFHSSGARVLLENIQTVHMGKPIQSKKVKTIVENADIQAWLSAYDSWIENVYEQFRKILQALHKKPPRGLNEWGERIDFGLRIAAKEPDRLKRSLNALSDFNWDYVAKKTLEFLPTNTTIQTEIYATIDGFNSGMFREERIFLSLILIDPRSIDKEFFMHELHHQGFEFWWRQHPLVRKYEEETDTREKWLLDIFGYIVSEGIANALCSPRAIKRMKGKSESIQLHNSIIENYEKNWDDLFNRLIRLLRSVIDSDMDNLVDYYEEFALDMSGQGHPVGHFVSGRMVQNMLESPEISINEVVNLTKKPFQFFKIYNRSLDSNEMNPIPEDIISCIDDILAEMR